MHTKQRANLKVQKWRKLESFLPTEGIKYFPAPFLPPFDVTVGYKYIADHKQ